MFTCTMFVDEHVSRIRMLGTIIKPLSEPTTGEAASLQRPKSVSDVNA